MTSIRGFSGEFTFLSNFEPCEIISDGILFKSVEHAFVAAKTLDRDTKLKISQIRTPGQAKRFGRKSLKLREDWEQIKVQIMFELLQQKFSMEPFKAKLLATGNSHIEETNNWNDTFWGVCNGVGQNKLGKLLMSVRDWLEQTADN